MVSIGKVLGDSLEAYRNNIGPHLLLTIVFTVVNSLSCSIFIGPLTAGYMQAQERAESGAELDIGSLFSCFDERLVPSLVAGLLALAAISVGLVFCLLPGLLLLPLLPAAVYQVALAGERNGVEAVKTAFSQLRATVLPASVLMMILGLIGWSGSLLCGVGVFITLPMVAIGQWLLARQMNGDVRPTFRLDL